MSKISKSGQGQHSGYSVVITLTVLLYILYILYPALYSILLLILYAVADLRICNSKTLVWIPIFVISKKFEIAISVYCLFIVQQLDLYLLNGSKPFLLCFSK